MLLFTDGACSGNPGPGGWAFILRDVKTNKELTGSGGERDSTNNRMEMQAVIQGLGALKKRCRVELYSDSSYVLQGLQSWIHGWKKRGWKTVSGTAIQNKDLWLLLDSQIKRHAATVRWIKGHNGDKWNEKADELARMGSSGEQGKIRI